MGSFSIWHWLIVLAVVLLLFGGRGKVSQLMGDFGKGLSAFKKGVGADRKRHRRRLSRVRSRATAPSRSRLRRRPPRRAERSTTRTAPPRSETRAT